MDSKVAYGSILRNLQAEARAQIVDSVYDEQNFGNFVVSFTVDSQLRSLVLDRGELAICSDLEGSENCRTVVQSIYELDEDAVLAAIAGHI
jgi:hypothetical protein